MVKQSISIVSILTLTLMWVVPSTTSASSHLTDRIIALDAGHGESESSVGASGLCDGVVVPEARVNEAVRAELAILLTAAGAKPFLIPQYDSRNARVDAAEEAGGEVLISIHHNGSSNTGANYTQSFVTQKNDREFAKFIHPALLDGLGFADKGIKNDGYGMTVYGSLPGVLTESYFITNSTRACEALAYLDGTNTTDSIVNREAQALFAGLDAYFAGQASGGGDTGGGGKPDKCNPRKGC